MLTISQYLWLYSAMQLSVTLYVTFFVTEENNNVGDDEEEVEI